MFSCTIPGIDDGHRGIFRRRLSRSTLIVANGNDIGIPAHHANCIADGLALGGRRIFASILRREHTAAQLLHRGLEGKSRSCTRLEKQRRKNPATERARQCAKNIVALHAISRFKKP
jgi:hypothetical protein